MFENNSSSEWLLYISEWAPPGGGMELSNIRVTTKVAVNALLGDTPALREYGTAIMHNLGTKEVKAVVRVFYKPLILRYVMPDLYVQWNCMMLQVKCKDAHHE